MFFLPAVHQSRRFDWILTAVLMNKVSKVDEKLCSLWHSMIWPGGKVELAHCVALCCVGLEGHTLKNKKTGFRGATVELPDICTGQSSSSLKKPVTDCTVTQ